MAALNELDASILAAIAQHSVRTGRKLKQPEVKVLLSKLQDADAKAVAMFFVEGKPPMNRPDLQQMADGLRSWAERNASVHANTSPS
jgi:hypothetical protein